MIIKLLFVIIILLILRIFLIRFDYRDYFYVTLTLLLIIICYFYIFSNSLLFIIPIFVISISLIVYSFVSSKTSDNTVIILNGNINFKNMFKNNFSIINLLEEIKKNNISFLDENICAILIDKKLIFYSKREKLNRPVSLIIDGNICLQELNKIGKSRTWLFNKLLEQKCNINDIFYSFIYKNKLYLIKK